MHACAHFPKQIDNIGVYWLQSNHTTCIILPSPESEPLDTPKSNTGNLAYNALSIVTCYHRHYNYVHLQCTYVFMCPFVKII